MGMDALRSLGVLALLLAGAVSVAGAAEVPSRALPPSPAAQLEEDPEHDQELDEIVVTGAKKVRKPEALIAWLRRLVGQFAYEGYVDLHSDAVPGGRRPVKGVSDCVGFGPAPGVQCVMKVVWPEVRGPDGQEVPGGISSLAPAMILYGLDADYLGIRYLQLDNKGLANSGQGYLRGDTLSTTAPCVDIPGNCRRITQISARPDGKLIQMQVDIEKDGERVARFMFVQRRLAQAAGGQPPVAPMPGTPGAPRR
jgi:hypothetical protein